MDYSGIYHNTGCSGFSLELNLKISVMMLNLFLFFTTIYAWYYSGLLIAGVISIKMKRRLHKSFMTTAIALSMHFLCTLLI
jgi:uncharacterized membrane protein YozB (DUF420 family)